jgi:hypothetical protein
MQTGPRQHNDKDMQRLGAQSPANDLHDRKGKMKGVTGMTRGSKREDERWPRARVCHPCRGGLDEAQHRGCTG